MNKKLLLLVLAILQSANFLWALSMPMALPAIIFAGVICVFVWCMYFIVSNQNS